MSNIIVIGGISYDKLARPLGPFRLRTAAEASGYSLKVVDYAWAFDEDKMLNLLEGLISDDTKILGISAAWFDRHYDGSANKWANQSFFNRFKEKYPNIEIVIGGTKTNAQPLLFNNASWFITGFSDIAFIKLLDYIYGKDTNLKYWKESNVKVIHGDSHYPVANMDDLETIFKPEDNFLSYQPMPLEVSRGCIFKCSFCTHPFLGKKSYDYIRSSESLAKELARNYALFGTYRYTISDDTFNDSYEKLDMVRRAVDIAKIPNFEFVGYIRPELLVTKTEMIPKLIDLGLKGCHLGVESMNTDARKVIGKGMDVNRVLEVVERLREHDVRVHASFIIGLPHETEEENYKCKDFLIANKHRYFQSWGFNGLGLVRGATGEGYSLFEKDPEKYGIKTFEIPNSMWLGWTNDYGMDNKKAEDLARKFNNESWPHQQFAGWTLAQAWFHNLTDDQIRNETHKSLNIDSLIKRNGIARAEMNYNAIVNTLR